MPGVELDGGEGAGVESYENCLYHCESGTILSPFPAVSFRYKPSREVGPFHENSSRLRAHGVQRCVHLPYVPPATLAVAGEQGQKLLGEGPLTQHADALVLTAS